MVGLPFYDILQNPEYRMLFEYSEPVKIDDQDNFLFAEDAKRVDENGKYIFEDDENEDDKDENVLQSWLNKLNLS